MNKVLLLVIILFVSLLSISNVLAIGITPGRTTLEFEPGASHEIQFSLVNTENKDMSVILYVKGELSDYVTLSQERISISSSESSKTLSYRVNLPTRFDKPGLHSAEIVALEDTGNRGADGTFIGARVGVETQIHVYEKYPGKYLSLGLDIIEEDAGQPISFFVPVVSRGEEDIEKANARIQIYFNGTLIDEIDLGEMSLLSGDRKEFSGKWNANAEAGKYKAKAIVSYDEKEGVIEKEFEIGESKIEIELITVKDFVLGEIAKFNILVNNKWTEEIKDVYVRMVVYALEGNVMADFKSPSYDIEAGERMEMTAFWDTEGVREGVYDGLLFLNYESEEDETNVKFKVEEDSLEVIGLTGKVIVKSEGTFSLKNILIIFVVVIILMNLVWFLFVKRLLKKKRGKKQKL